MTTESDKREVPERVWIYPETLTVSGCNNLGHTVEYIRADLLNGKVRASVLCACRTFNLDSVTRAYLSGKFIHTTVECPTLPLHGDQSCLICHHERYFYNAEADACEHVTELTKIDIFCGCACRFLVPDAATRMRAACVEKVRELQRDWDRAQSYDFRDATFYVVAALESLTLDQVEKKQ